MKKDDKLLAITILILIGLFLIFESTIFKKPLLPIEQLGPGAVASTASLNITIRAATSPTIIIVNPQNMTYNHREFQLHFAVYGEGSLINRIEYKLNNGPNITITSNITSIEAQEGANTLFIYANNSDGVRGSNNVTFSVNTSLEYFIDYPDYFFFPGSNSTNFSLLSRSEMESMANFTLHTLDLGFILFDDIINLSATGNYSSLESRQIVNLTRYTNISRNRIFIDSANLPNLNKSATLRLYNLTLIRPKIQRDDEDCPSSICSIISYSGGTLEFTVTHFTEYEAGEEGGIGGVTETVSGGGGGGSRLRRGETSVKIGREQIQEKKGLFNIVIRLIPKASSKTIEEVNITLANETIKESLDVGYVTSELPSREQLERSAIEETIAYEQRALTQETPEIGAGEEMIIEIDISSLNGTINDEISVEYVLLNDYGEIMFWELERRIIDEKLAYTKEVKIPLEVEPKEYLFAVKTKYKGYVDTTTHPLKVIEKRVVKETEIASEVITSKTEKPTPSAQKEMLKTVWTILTILGLTIAVIFLLLLYNKKSRRGIKSKNKKDKLTLLTKSLEEKKRLIEEVKRLDKAYRSGVIEKKGYEKTKKELMKKIK
ncbi:hypothetical protein HYT51_00870 [Candidatus Woesearchaeota archaeon]|nr:hypothetical protein [Candidatus Woesearchaeota archaeon]